MRFLGFLVIWVISTASITDAKGQCLTGFQKLLPDKTPGFSEAFGQTVSIYDDVMAVGAPQSDSLGVQGAGIVYVYQKSGGSWSLAGVLKPSVPVAQMGFGRKVLVSQNYILVGCFRSNAGVYIFRKPVSGWNTSVETTILKPTNGVGFGSSFDISTDEQTIGVVDIGYSAASGAFFVFRKSAGDEWTNLSPVQIVENPDKNNGVIFFGIGGIEIDNDRIVCATASQYSANVGTIYVFRTSGIFPNYQLEARLTDGSTSTGSYGPTFLMNDDGIFKYRERELLFYQSPASGTWMTGGPTCVIPINGISDMFFVNYTSSDNKFYFSIKQQDNSGRIVKLTKAGSDWCSGISQEIIYSEPALQNGKSQLFVRSISSYGDSEIACSWIAPPNSNAAMAVGVLSLQPNGSWFNELIVKTKKTALNFNLGNSIYSSGDFLFGSAINESIMDTDPRGAVYISKKIGSSWSKINKITLETTKSTDSGFGGFITGYADYLAITAYGYSPSGILIYKGINGDFSNPSFIQRLPIPTGQSIDRLGSPVMNKDWLVVPTLRNPGSVFATLLFYKKTTSDQWIFDFSLDLPNGIGNVVFKRTPVLDLKGNTLVTSNGSGSVYIIEFDEASRQWKINYTLTASDPDRDPFIVIFNFTVTIDGSQFGSSVKLTDNAIFVGAPGKNNGGMLDVGAVYVYTKNANGLWSSGTETIKLLPATPAVQTFFGTSIDVLDNTLLTGAVGNGAPGKVFVIQSKDFYWKNTIQLLELTGDSFSEDYFGYDVVLRQDDFFISSPKESNSASPGAGAIYVVAPPPLVKLEPPVCDFREPFNLKGYPFNGVWSGPGIVDVNTGKFDPIAAGIGKHILTYNTPNCFYPGYLEIEVVSSPKGVVEGVVNNIICTSGKTEVTLSVQEESNTTYTWYFQSLNSTDYVSTGVNQHQIKINNSKPGKYQLVSQKSICTIVHNFDVTLEKLDVKMNPLPVICDPSLKSINLITNYQGGTWSIQGASSGSINQSSGVLDLSKLKTGNYIVQYQYQSAPGCLYEASQPLVIDLLEKPEIELTGNICVGNAKIVTKGIDQRTTIVWFKDNTTTTLPFASGVASLSASGDYHIELSKGECKVKSETIHVEPARDSLFVPNVITPNGDFQNDEFRVAGENLRDFNLIVINRNGNRVFSTQEASFKWPAEGISPGTYFWYASYTNCANETTKQRGWLSILR